MSKMFAASIWQLKSANLQQSSTDELQKEAFRQALLYLVMMGMSWILLLMMVNLRHLTCMFDGFLFSHYHELSVDCKSLYIEHYYLWMTALCLIPLQGFMNSLLYFRPHMVHVWKKWRKSRRERKTNIAPEKLDNDCNITPQQSSLCVVAKQTSEDNNFDGSSAGHVISSWFSGLPPRVRTKNDRASPSEQVAVSSKKMNSSFFTQRRQTQNCERNVFPLSKSRTNIFLATEIDLLRVESTRQARKAL
jgi:hypothetical protein